MIEDNNLDVMFDQAVARAHNLSLQKQDCVFASLYPTLLSGEKCSPFLNRMIVFTEKRISVYSEQQNHTKNNKDRQCE